MSKPRSDDRPTFSNKARSEFDVFDDAMGKLLKPSKNDVEKKMEREKKAREKRRKAG